MAQNKTQNKVKNKAKVKKLVSLIKSFLKQDGVKFSTVSDECIEVYIQANNVNLVILIYVSNGHIIVRTPEFVRNIQLKRMKILLFLMQIMNDVLDIRFEISDDGESLSSSCQHILEDGIITKDQFDFMMMIVISVTDDVYPKLMEILYAKGEFSSIDEDFHDDNDDDDLLGANLFDELEGEIEEELEALDEDADSNDDDHNIN